MTDVSLTHDAVDGLALRNQSDEITRRAPLHPAKFSDTALDAANAVLGADPDLRVLDPFAGVGSVHHLPYRTVGLEIEPEWAAAHSGTLVGDAKALPFGDGTFDAAVTSPCYGNRMADHHEARDASIRHTYRHCLGRPLSDGSAGSLQWGDAYRELHHRAWGEVYRVLRPDGLCLVVVSDHVRKGLRQRVVDWHVQALLDAGFSVDQVLGLPAHRLRHGANALVRVVDEKLLVVRR
jgi:tRNA G10  N-methylase Trm11